MAWPAGHSQRSLDKQNGVWINRTLDLEFQAWELSEVGFLRSRP